MARFRTWCTLPRDLYARLCCIFLLMNLAVIVGELLQISLQSSKTPLWPWPVVALFALSGLQFWNYRTSNRHYRYPQVLIESCLVGIAILGGTDLRIGLWLVFIPIELRSLYGGWSHVLAVVIGISSAFLGSLALWPAVHMEPAPLAPSEVIDWVIGFVFVGGFAHVLALLAARHERGAARERSLAHTGLALVGALNRAQVEAAAIDAVTDLLTGCATDLVALLLLEPAENWTVVAAQGPHAKFLRGKRFSVAAIPSGVRQLAENQVVLDRAATAAVQHILGLPYVPGVVTLTQLRVKGRQIGTLVVESPNRLPAETADGLSTIGVETALALESARLTEHLHDLAYRDPLTGLANRACFLERMQDAVARYQSDGTRLAVLFIDLDDFKVINDSMGHAAGDRLLCTVSDRLRSCIREVDMIARLGGDEFTILLEGSVSPEQASALAHRLACELRQPVQLDGRTLVVGASVGVALSDDVPAGCGVTVEELLRAADLALYAAKARGKGQWSRFERAMATRAVEHLELESELRAALRRGEFEVYYQPLISFDSGTVQGVEALVRWNHPVRGTLAPAVFIHLAEETGLIVPLGRWVLEAACRDVRRWQVESYSYMSTPLQLSVNLSARQLEDPRLVNDVSHILETTQLEPATLRLEITESVAVVDTPRTRLALAQLRTLGVQLAIDDFGTGNSALEYLRRFPVDTLKIDRSFVQDLGRDERGTALVRGMVALAKSLGLQVTGEGIETAQQSDELRAMGCELGQGFLFARPLRGVELEEHLRVAGLLGGASTQLAA